VNALGIDGARRRAELAHERTLELLGRLPGDTAELLELTELVAHRTS
jgi:hypothetical protein